MTRALLSSLLLSTACTGGVTPSQRAASPADAVGAGVVAAQQLAHPKPPESTLGWNIDVIGGVVSWRECTGVSECSNARHERDASDLLAVEHAGRFVADRGQDVDVLRLKFRPRGRATHPIEQQPIWKPVQ